MSYFQQVLTEIVADITIDLDFTIAHPDYPPLETNPETLDKLHQLAPDLQQKYLIAQVQNYLYSIYFSHSSIGIRELEAASQQQVPVKNNMIDGIDIDFYPRLMQSNTSSGYVDPDWEIFSATDWGELIVVKEGLHLHIDPDRHLAPEVSRAVGSVVPIYLPPNLVGRDTYIAIGNAGCPDTESIEIYFNFTPDPAVEIFRALIIELNQLGIPFQFAILHDPALFHRYDAGTLTLSQADYDLVHPVLAKIYQTYQAAFAAPVPLFSKQLAPGLGLIEKLTSFDSFGLHRCQLVATGLVSAIRRGQTSSAEKLNLIEQEFESAAVNLYQPHLSLAGVVGVGEAFASAKASRSRSVFSERDAPRTERREASSLLGQTLRERNGDRYPPLFG